VFIFCIEFLLVIKASGAGSAREVIRLRSLSSWVDHLKILFGLMYFNAHATTYFGCR
jgi:hypothetical protein